MQHAPLTELVREELAWGIGFRTSRPSRCRCAKLAAVATKALEALATSAAERAEMIEQDGGAEVVCHWCGEKRWVSADHRHLTGPEIRCRLRYPVAPRGPGAHSA